MPRAGISLRAGSRRLALSISVSRNRGGTGTGAVGRVTHTPCGAEPRSGETGLPWFGASSSSVGNMIEAVLGLRRSHFTVIGQVAVL